MQCVRIIYQNLKRADANRPNRSSNTIENVVSSISLAVQGAIDTCPSIKGQPLQSIELQAVWIGLAGYDRPNIANTVNSALSKLFQRRCGKDFRITTDIDLLLSPFVYEHQLDSAIVLVAGTGSTAMSYRRDGNDFIRTGRCGGWGHLLGDDGSGYAMGREALRVALGEAEQFNLSLQGAKAPEGFEFDLLTESIFEYFELSRQPTAEIDLLSQILLSTTGDSQRIKQIAKLSKVVLGSAGSSETANSIARASSQSLARLVMMLIKSQALDLRSSALCLSGGLMQNEEYLKLLKKDLESDGLNFSQIRRINLPALEGARYLLKSLQN